MGAYLYPGGKMLRRMGGILMKPVLFTVSSDGRSIQGLSNQMESIEIQRVSKNDYELDTINRDTTSIEQVKLKSRYADPDIL